VRYKKNCNQRKIRKQRPQDGAVMELGSGIRAPRGNPNQTESDSRAEAWPAYGLSGARTCGGSHIMRAGCGTNVP